MAETLAGQLIDKLVRLIEENVSFIVKIKSYTDELVEELKSLNALLMQASSSQSSSVNDNYVVKDVVEKIRNVVNESEDVLEKYTVERKIYEEQGMLRRLNKAAHYAKVSDFSRQIQAIIDRVKKIRRDHQAALQLLINDHQTGQPAIQRMAPVVEEEDVVGFDDEAKIIKDRLKDKSINLEVISIEGMAGLGKTTLTKLVYNDRDLDYGFFSRLWIYVSKAFNRKQIFLNILSKFTQNTKKFHDMSEENLAEEIKEKLSVGKYFIVMDDVWTKDAWECLKIAFPNNLKGSRILLTTRHHSVALHADSAQNPHKLKFLSNKESEELLEKRVFRKERCPSVLKDLGMRIAIKCNGLPLAIVVIAGVLVKDNTLILWKQVAENPILLINRDCQDYTDLVKLSYDQLHINLRDCFLYLAAFPTGHEIAAWKLIRLWIAEGFIPTTDGERVAEKYLKDLVDRNLLMVLKRRADGQIKTCSIHDTLHEFCKNEAISKNLFHVIGVDGSSKPEAVHRRLCFHSSILNFLGSRSITCSENVHSILSFCPKEIDIPNDCTSTIPKSFPLLRVMEVESLKFKMLPREFYVLYHLRYLAVSTELKILPKLFGNLWNMQTLVFNASESSVEVKADIWNDMPKLRHVHSNTSMKLPPPKSSKNSSGSADIQTLSTISPSSCTQEIFDKTPNLQKLGIRGNLVELMESRGGNSLFENLQNLDSLENLKLINDVFQGNKLRRFPRPEKFPPRLRKITLSNTGFDWKDFSILGSIEELEVLKLEENAFSGELCDVSNTVFKQLQYLRIGRTNLASWTISKDTFRVLKYLIIRHCSTLDVVPSAFAQVDSLKVMELFYTNKKAVASAQEIQNLKLAANQNNNTSKKGGFQLSIYPPTDH